MSIQIISSVQDLRIKVENLKQILVTKQNKMEVVIAGNVKAGKSTLINAIFNDENLCSTGVIRTTVENQMIESEHYRILDTPGINANDDDTAVAEQGYNRADFFIYVHNVVEGEFLAQELSFLKQISDYFSDDEQFIRNTLVILTNAHQLDEEALLLAKTKIEEQLRLITNKPVKLFIVDSISYLNALASNKQLLMEESQIPVLQHAIEAAAIYFKENVLSEREGIDSPKKEAMLKEINEYDINLKKELQALTENKMSNQQINGLLLKVKLFKEEAKKILDSTNIINTLTIDTDAYIFVEEDIYSDPDYKSEYSAESAAVNFIRNLLLPGAERSYIKKRLQMIEDYRELLPNFNGEDSKVTLLQKEVESHLSQLKKTLLPLANTLDLVEIANTNTAFNIPHQKLYDEAVFQLSSSLYPPGYEDDYAVESTSWYKDFINTEESIEYVSGFFGDREVTRYCYDLMEAKAMIEKHVSYSLEAAHTTLRLNFLNVYGDYQTRILKEVDNVINRWVNVLDMQIQSNSEDEAIFEKKAAEVNQQLNEVQKLRQIIETM